MANKELRQQLNDRAKQLKEAIRMIRMNTGKIAAVIGCSESYFRTSSGIAAGPQVVTRFHTLFPNVSTDWLFLGKGPMLTHGEEVEAPRDLLRPSVAKITNIMKNLYGVEGMEPNRTLAVSLLLQNDIDPVSLYNRYPELFPILAPSDTSATDFCDTSDVDYQPLPSSPDDRDLVIAQLQAENRTLRTELSKRDATIAHFLDLAMKYIETKEGNK